MRRFQLRSGRLIAATALSAVVLSAGPAPLFAQVPAEPPAALSGRIFLSDASTPVNDAVVKAIQHGSQEVFQSDRSTGDGSYSLALAAGEYDLGIETPAGIYLVEGTLKVAPGQRRAASFALKPNVAAEGQSQPAEGVAGVPATPAADPNQSAKPTESTQNKPAQGKKQLKRPRATGSKQKALITTGVVVGGAIVIGALANGVSNDGDGSPNR